MKAYKLEDLCPFVHVTSARPHVKGKADCDHDLGGIIFISWDLW